MSIENFDGDGLAYQPSVVYDYTDDQDDFRIKEFHRSGYGELGLSLGEVLNRELTKSSPNASVSELLTLGGYGVQYYDCAEDVPALPCLRCGSDDPVKARTADRKGSNYLNIRYIALKQAQKQLRSKRQRSRTATSWLTWPVTTRYGSRTYGFFCNRNKRLAFGQWLR